ncbi:unnamed protein product [Brassica rapa]|uniref:Uncharacterized protein n=1 Tax=Brassica campestris TaxID=3711 RepID=A0A8D9GYA1_BRACM|nr:unnamed protein product [Brassica rapa]
MAVDMILLDSQVMSKKWNLWMIRARPVAYGPGIVHRVEPVSLEELGRTRQRALLYTLCTLTCSYLSLDIRGKPMRVSLRSKAMYCLDRGSPDIRGFLGEYV